MTRNTVRFALLTLVFGFAGCTSGGAVSNPPGTDSSPAARTEENGSSRRADSRAEPEPSKPADPDSPAALVRRLGDPEFVVRERAHRKLIRKGREAFPALIAALEDPDEEIRWRADAILHDIGWPDEELIRAYPAKSRTGLKLFESFYETRNLNLVDFEHTRLIRLAAKKLSESPHREEVLDIHRKTMHSPHREIRYYTAISLGILEWEEGTDLLETLYRDTDEAVKFAAASSLHTMGKPEPARELIAKYEGYLEPEEGKEPEYERGGALYNLACLHSLTGRVGTALDYLRQAVEAGYRELHWISVDPDLFALHGEKRYEEILDSIRQQQ